MSLPVLDFIQRKSNALLCKTALYRWVLRGDIPDRLVVKPVDVWPGDPDRAAWIMHNIELHQDWPDALQGFEWLRDLGAYAGIEHITEAQEYARHAIGAWITLYGCWHPEAWAPGFTGQRIAAWIAFYEFFGDDTGFDGHEDFQDQFFDSLIRQARHLCRIMDGKTDTPLYGLEKMQAIKGLLYAGLGFEGHEDWAQQALALFIAEMKAQILPDGGHISRSPARTLSCLQILLDVRTALNAAGYTIPDALPDTIQRTSKALQFLRYNDKGFALFHETQEGNRPLIDRALAQAGLRGKVISKLPDMGYQRVIHDRTTIMMDVGNPPPHPYADTPHTAPLAFEMCYGKDRVLVSCGTHTTCADWQEALRATAAHTTVCMDNRNAHPKAVTFKKQTAEGACLLEGSHDGYVKINGMHHDRSLYLDKAGHDLRGEDYFHAKNPPAKPVDIAVRFHIHPRVMVSLIQDGEEALLRMPGGIGWRFSFDGGLLALEDSIYMGQNDEPRKTKQLVIYGQFSASEARLKWALRREG